jgi:hypothetical protein
VKSDANWSPAFNPRIVGSSPASDEVHYEGVPFFWTKLWQVHRLSGASGRWDEIVFDGDPEGLKFIANYLKHEGGE